MDASGSKTCVIFDYGFGNVHSAKRAFSEIGFEVEITNDRTRCLAADLLVIPGVGSFDECMKGFAAAGGAGIFSARVDAGKKTFGICVGFQILFDRGFEGAEAAGLGCFAGEVRRLGFATSPHMGWNLIEGGAAGEPQAETDPRYYFVHSYGVQPSAALKSQVADLGGSLYITTYQGVEFVSMITTPAVSGAQFHPEKSDIYGLQLLSALA